MTRPDFQRAVNEAKRFLDAAVEVKWDGAGRYPTDGKANAACKRASMDLTRALAQMRKP